VMWTAAALIAVVTGAGCGGGSSALSRPAPSTVAHTQATRVVPRGLALGKAVAFHSVPGIGPAVSLKLVAAAPVDPGTAEDGSSQGTFQAGQVWPATANQSSAQETVDVRFVNVPVQVENAGHKPVRVVLTGGATDEDGHEAGSILRQDQVWPGPHGRQPNWTANDGPPVAPGSIVTRYLTFPVERGRRITQISVSAETVAGGATRTTEPDAVTYRGP
jgi:hypothetical protein